MIKFDGKTLVIDKKITLSPSQIYKCEGLRNAQREAYALSLIGLSRSRLPVKKHLKYIDTKNANDTFYKFKNLLNNSGNIDHKPLLHTLTSKWIGIEIECLFDESDYSDEDNCECCDRSGEVTCYNCEGDRTVTCHDSHGNTYENDCSSCDGTGTMTCSECDGSSSNKDNLKDIIRAKLKANKITLCSVRSDGSLSGDDKVGVEVTVLLNATNGFDKLKKVCKVLNDMGASVNETCGLHVHIDQHGRTKDQVVSNGASVRSTYAHYLPLLSSLVPRSRVENSYCVSRVSDSDRYSAVNLTSFSKHGTVEVRLHSGSTNAEKIEHWVRCLLAIDSMALTPISCLPSVANLESLKLPEITHNYLKLRQEKFNPSNNLEDNETSGSDDESLESVG